MQDRVANCEENLGISEEKKCLTIGDKQQQQVKQSNVTSCFPK